MRRVSPTVHSMTSINRKAAAINTPDTAAMRGSRVDSIMPHMRMGSMSVRAVENGRYRLRKKLGLTSAQNLNEFLLHIDSQESGPEDDEK